MSTDLDVTWWETLDIRSRGKHNEFMMFAKLISMRADKHDDDGRVDSSLHTVLHLLLHAAEENTKSKDAIQDKTLWKDLRSLRTETMVLVRDVFDLQPEKGWSSLPIRNGWVQVIRGPRPPSEKWPSAGRSQDSSMRGRWKRVYPQQAREAFGTQGRFGDRRCISGGGVEPTLGHRGCENADIVRDRFHGGKFGEVRFLQGMSRREEAQYGLRASSVGEARHPGPPGRQRSNQGVPEDVLEALQYDLTQDMIQIPDQLCGEGRQHLYRAKC